VSNDNDALAGVCSKAEIEAVKRDGELRGLKHRAARLRVIALDAQLAVAVAENDKACAETVGSALRRALFELESMSEFENLENIRMAKLISSMTWEQN
jgi:hypothetical protein